MKTVRFAEVVKAGGAPETYVLWVPAKQDARFQSALKANRIVTVQQDIIGSKKDFGEVGYKEQPNAQLLIFPKSVKRFANRRIIGMNYELLAKESRVTKSPERVLPKARPKNIAKPAKEIIATPEPSPEPPPSLVEPKHEHAAPVKERVECTEEISKPKPDPKPDEDVKEWDVAEVRKIIERAMKELKSGKAVAAYERLAKLADSL
jgi:outer membrane biosynthesis protein TonB